MPEAILAHHALEVIHDAIPYAIAISAASFLYIVLADLTPELYREVKSGYIIRQLLLMLAWAGTVMFFLQSHPQVSEEFTLMSDLSTNDFLPANDSAWLMLRWQGMIVN